MKHVIEKKNEKNMQNILVLGAKKSQRTFDFLEDRLQRNYSKLK